MGSEDLPEGAEGLSEGSEGQTEGSESLSEGSEGMALGGRTNILMDRLISPYSKGLCPLWLLEQLPKKEKKCGKGKSVDYTYYQIKTTHFIFALPNI